MEVVDVVVHYGAGNVGVNESGVDLSEFGNMLIQLTDPVNLRIAAIQQYFTINFRFDPNIWDVKIQSVWSKSRTNIFRELLPLDRTSQWTSWLASCKRRGTQPETLLVFYLKENNLEHGGGVLSMERVVSVLAQRMLICLAPWKIFLIIMNRHLVVSRQDQRM